MRLFKTLLLLMLVASLVPTVMVGLLSVSDTRELLVRDAQELAQERVKQLKLKAEIFLAEPTRAVMSIARVPQFFSLPLEQQQTYLRAVFSQCRELQAITLLGPDGRRLPRLQAYSAKEVPPTAIAEHEARALRLIEGFGHGFNGEGLSSLRYADVVGRSDGEAVVTFVLSVGEPVQGYIAADVSLGDLQNMLAQERVGSAGFVYLTDTRGRIIAGGGGLVVHQDASTRPVVAYLLADEARTDDTDILHVGNFGTGAEAVVAAYALLADPHWAIISEQPVALAYKQVETMERRLLLTVLTATLVALGLAAFFSRGVTRPLRGFTQGALELAQGKFGLEVSVPQKNELGDLARTFNYMSKQLLAYDHENRGLYASLEQGYLETIAALANSIDSKDPYTRGHSQRVGDVAVEIGRELDLSERELKHLQFGGILHDIGKIGIAEQILCKKDRLTDEEMAIMRRHPDIGDTIIRPISFLAPMRACVRSHHERWDGTGYPDGLKGEEIPLLARIVGCADTFDACTSTRPYQTAMPLGKAMEILENLSGRQLDPAVVAALRRVLQKRGVRVEGHRQPVKLAS